ncbi:MAG TPA: addiction module protein [Acidobacteriaceae bacterium]
MTTAAIEHMSWEDKLRTLEELWEAITSEGDRYQSPAWHEEALKETERRVESGSEESIDWVTAKRELRK